MATDKASLIARGIDPFLWNAWVGMRQRCIYPKHQMYKYYGGRGIQCCARWASFRAFEQDVLATIGPHPGQGWTLDRIKTNGNYRRGNVRWATRAEQARTRRRCEKRKLTPQRAAVIRAAKGSSYEIAKRFNVHATTVQRIRNGSAWVE